MLMGEDLVDQGLSAKMVAIILGVVRDHKVSLSVSPHPLLCCTRCMEPLSIVCCLIFSACTAAA